MLDDRGPVGINVPAAGLGGSAVGIVKLVAEPGVMGRHFLKENPEFPTGRILLGKEGPDDNLALGHPAQDLDGLHRDRMDLVPREVDPPVVPACDEIHQDEDRQKNSRGGRNVKLLG